MQRFFFYLFYFIFFNIVTGPELRRAFFVALLPLPVMLSCVCFDF